MFKTKKKFKTSHIETIKKYRIFKDFNSSCFVLWLLLIEARDKIVLSRVITNKKKLNSQMYWKKIPFRCFLFFEGSCN